MANAVLNSIAVDAEPKRPIVELLTLAAPTVAQMASYTVMQFIDTWMLSHLGVEEPTAAANSGMMALSVLGFGMGVIWIVNTLVSQHFGRKDYRACGRYLWQGIWFAVVYSLLLLPFLPTAWKMFHLFGHSPQQVQLEGIYFRILLYAAVIKMTSTAFGQFLLAVNRPVEVFVAAVLGVGANIIAAWIMVFGTLGVKPMGVAGAAWGQNIGVSFELLLLVAFALRPKLVAKFNALDWKPRPAVLRTLMLVGLPSGAQFIADILAWSLFCNVVIGRLGEKAMAANTFMIRYMVVSFMPAIGFANAVTALVGRYIGAGKPEVAVQRAHLGFKVTAAYMMGCGVLFYIGRNQLIRVFSADPEILRIGAMYLTFAAIYQLFDAMYIVYNGALRGAGDTFVPAVATFGLCWGITVAGGFLAATFAPQFLAGPWVLATVYGIILGLFIGGRFLKGKWKEIRLEGGARELVPQLG
ncbi:MAG TPA: MATE family efflux transporter [Tepidisphaeraceae bacterium]|jgi:MATE family multidrug resistance protein